jgi:hypothetical protein
MPLLFSPPAFNPLMPLRASLFAELLYTGFPHAEFWKNDQIEKTPNIGVSIWKRAFIFLAVSRSPGNNFKERSLKAFRLMKSRMLY